MANRSILRKLSFPAFRASKRLAAGLWNIFSRSPRLAALYYLVDPSYRRDQQSMLAGMTRYEREKTAPIDSSTELRRNVHRIEKGLLMRPRRVPFALDYIDDTVAAFAKAIARGVHRDELEWACDVLHAYFDLHSQHTALDHARRAFESLEHDLHSASREKRVPYQRAPSGSLPSIDQFEALCGQRKSVRWFSDLPVPRAVIDRAIASATLAPSACNRQPFQFRVLDDPALVARASRIPYGTRGYGDNIPALAVIIGTRRSFFSARDRHLIYVDASLAIMGFVLALESMGVGTCCVNWPDLEENERQMAELLQLAPDERPVMLVAFGYPDPTGLVAHSTKKPLSLIRRFNLE